MAVGKISRGKYTCCINEELDTRQPVQLLVVCEKALKIKIPIIMYRGNNVSESPRRIMNTR